MLQSLIATRALQAHSSSKLKMTAKPKDLLTCIFALTYRDFMNALGLYSIHKPTTSLATIISSINVAYKKHTNI